MTKRYLLRIATPLVLISVVAVLGQAFDGGALDLQWHTVDGGGGVSTGGGLQLAGTIGQPDTAVLSSNNFVLAGGFWLVKGSMPCPSDLNQDGVVNSIDLTLLLACFNMPADECPHKCDINGDGQCNSIDLTLLLAKFNEPCP